MVCGRERVKRSGRGLSRPRGQRRGGGLSTLRSVRTTAIGDAKMVRLRHRCPKCRRDSVARLMDTNPHRFLLSFRHSLLPGPRAFANKVTLEISRPRQPTDYGYIESFNSMSVQTGSTNCQPCHFRSYPSTCQESFVPLTSLRLHGILPHPNRLPPVPSSGPTRNDIPLGLLTALPLSF